jgi:DNA-directed RNA polymerase subunit RPC12/RpoP
MDKLEPVTPTLISYRCSSCSRGFVACGDVISEEILCTCGARLVAAPLPRGVYELRSAIAEHARITNPASRRPEEKEADLGYGASHGNPVGHEGPTGPGDAPAREPPAQPVQAH